MIFLKQDFIVNMYFFRPIFAIRVTKRKCSCRDSLVSSEEKANHWFNRAEHKTFNNCNGRWKKVDVKKSNINWCFIDWGFINRTCLELTCKSEWHLAGEDGTGSVSGTESIAHTGACCSLNTKRELWIHRVFLKYERESAPRVLTSKRTRGEQTSSLICLDKGFNGRISHSDLLLVPWR